jgi:hypothetical protein
VNRARQVAAAAVIRGRLQKRLDSLVAVSPYDTAEGELFDALSRAARLADRRQDELVRGRCP